MEKQAGGRYGPGLGVSSRGHQSNSREADEKVFRVGETRGTTREKVIARCERN